MLTDEKRNVCVLADDPRLIEGGSGAFGAHAARLAGLSRPDQEKVAESAVRIATAAFEKSKNEKRRGFRLRLAIVNLANVVEVSMEAESANGAVEPNIFDVAQENSASASPNSVQWQAQSDACLLTIVKTPEARNAAVPSGSFCS